MNALFRFIISFLDASNQEVTSIEVLDKDTIKIICDDFYSENPEYIKHNYEYDESVDKVTLIWKYKELWAADDLVFEIKEIKEMLKNEDKNGFIFFKKNIIILDYLKRNGLVSGYRIRMPQDELKKKLEQDLGWGITEINIALIYLCYLNIYQVNNINHNEFDTYYSLNTYSGSNITYDE